MMSVGLLDELALASLVDGPSYSSGGWSPLRSRSGSSSARRGCPDAKSVVRSGSGVAIRNFGHLEVAVRRLAAEELLRRLVGDLDHNPNVAQLLLDDLLQGSRRALPEVVVKVGIGPVAVCLLDKLARPVRIVWSSAPRTG